MTMATERKSPITRFLSNLVKACRTWANLVKPHLFSIRGPGWLQPRRGSNQGGPLSSSPFPRPAPDQLALSLARHLHRQFRLKPDCLKRGKAKSAARPIAAVSPATYIERVTNLY